MLAQLPLFDAPNAVPASPLYDGEPRPCAGEGCNAVAPIYGTRIIGRWPGSFCFDLCLGCTIAYVRWLRSEGTPVSPEFGWVV